MWCLSESKTTLWRWIWNVPPPPPLSSDCQLSSYGQQHSRQSSLRCLYISTGEICKSSCSGDPVSGDVTSSHDPCVISVAPEDTHILHIPFQKLKRIFSKSSQILSNTASNIHKFGDNVYYVASKPSLDNPHKVIHRGNGKFICDTSCVNWATYKFCAHTLALAEVSEETRLFLNKVAMEAEPDATSLALLDMLKGRGKKAADRATTRRKDGPVRKKSRVVETYTTPTVITATTSTSDNTRECPLLLCLLLVLLPCPWLSHSCLWTLLLLGKWEESIPRTEKNV